LVEYEYLCAARGGSERSTGFHGLKEDASPAEVDLSMIPSPEAMPTIFVEMPWFKGYTAHS
jgi:hypothetical protein